MNQVIEIYVSQNGDARLEVALDKDTAWLTQGQMRELFGRDQSVLSRHIRSIFQEGELVERGNMQKMHIAGSDKPVTQYSLDVIISVGYRVKSQSGVQFRQWATQTLKQHLVQGYTLNQKRMQERGIEFEQVVSLLSQTLSNQSLIQPEGAAVLEVIHDYARSWSLLQSYDEQSLGDITMRQHHMVALDFRMALAAIAELKQELISKGGGHASVWPIAWRRLGVGHCHHRAGFWR